MLQVLGLVHIDTSTSPGTRVRVSKHEFICIPIAAVHNNTGSLYTSVSYLEIQAVFVYSSSFHHEKQQKLAPDSFDINNYVIIMAYT